MNHIQGFKMKEFAILSKSFQQIQCLWRGFLFSVIFTPSQVFIHATRTYIMRFIRKRFASVCWDAAYPFLVVDCLSFMAIFNDLELDLTIF